MSLLILTSTSKTLNSDVHRFKDTKLNTSPAFLNESEKVMNYLNLMDVSDLQSLMKVSEPIARECKDWIESWSALKHHKDIAVPAIHMYRGTIFNQISPSTYSVSQQRYIQNSLRILSGLYGILRPYDRVLPYRLEMKTKLMLNDRHTRLDLFWKGLVTDSLNKDTIKTNSNIIVNLSSDEYFKAIDIDLLTSSIINIDFKEWDKGKLKSVAVYSKQARGAFIEYMVRNEIYEIKDLRNFRELGYDIYSNSDEEIVFAR